jgi:hypothetical protein
MSKAMDHMAASGAVPATATMAFAGVMAAGLAALTLRKSRMLGAPGTVPGVLGGTDAATVASLHIYPVKGMHGHSVAAAAVDAAGFAWDRRWMVVKVPSASLEGGSDAPQRVPGRFQTQRQIPRMAAVHAQVVLPRSLAGAPEAAAEPAVVLASREDPPLARPALRLALPRTAERVPGAPPLPSMRPIVLPVVTRADVAASLKTGADAAGADAVPAGVRLLDVVIWRDTVARAVDQGDEAAWWLRDALLAGDSYRADAMALDGDELRLVYMDGVGHGVGVGSGGDGCVRPLKSSYAPPADAWNGIAETVSFADGYPCERPAGSGSAITVSRGHHYHDHHHCHSRTSLRMSDRAPLYPATHVLRCSPTHHARVTG